MTTHSPSRRAALRSLGGAVTAAIAGTTFTEIARAAHEAHEAARSPTPVALTLLGAADAADVEALTSQIVPSDDTPGAREAGVTYFIDRALGSFFGHWRESFTLGLRDFQATCRAQHPDVPSFAALSSDEQIAFLHGVDRTPFFDQARMLTLCGMFSLPKYGGNRDSVGWKLLGFEDRHTFEPPFGYYDVGHHDAEAAP